MLPPSPCPLAFGDCGSEPLWYEGHIFQSGNLFFSNSLFFSFLFFFFSFKLPLTSQDYFCRKEDTFHTHAQTMHLTGIPIICGKTILRDISGYLQ